MRSRHVTLGFLALACLAACGKDGPADPATRTVDDYLAELTGAKLAVEGVAPADGAALGGECKQAVVAGIGVTVCGFKDAAAAKAAQPKGLAAVGDATGAALAHGRLLLIVTDRAGKDPSGKALNQITRQFLQR